MLVNDTKVEEVSSNVSEISDYNDEIVIKACMEGKIGFKTLCRFIKEWIKYKL